MFLLLAMFTAWPIGIAAGMLVSGALGGGYAQAALAGILTSAVVAWLLGFMDGLASPYFLVLMLVAGSFSGLFGWRAVMR